jgi:hypothetical protein
MTISAMEDVFLKIKHGIVMVNANIFGKLVMDSVTVQITIIV